MYNNPWFFVAASAIFLIGITKSGFGSGVGLIVVPLLALAMGHGAFPGRGEQAALGLALPLLVSGDLISIWQHRRFFTNRTDAAPSSDSPRKETLASNGATLVAQAPSLTSSPHTTKEILHRLLPGTVAGVVIGSLLLWWFNKQQEVVSSLMRIEIGLESILLVGLYWWRQYRGVQSRLMSEPARGTIIGIFTGASSTLAHAAGPIVAMYLLPLRLERKLFVATCALFFFILNSMKLPSYYAAGQFEHAQLGFTLKFLPLVLAGAFFGVWLNKRLNDKIFMNILYLCTFALGWYILWDGVRSLVK